MDSKHDMKEDSKHDTREDSPPPYLDSTRSQIFTVDYVHWRRTISILDPTGQPLFVSKSASASSTYLEINNNNGQVIGTSKCSNLTSKVEVQITSPGQSFEMHNSGSLLGGSPGYTSPAFSGEKVVWKNKARSRKIIYTLIDSKAMGVARFESDPKTQIGKLELTHEAVAEERLNEIAVTLLTLLHRKLRNLQAPWIVGATT